MKCEKSEICIQVKKFMKHFPFFAYWTVQQMLEPILYMLQSLYFCKDNTYFTKIINIKHETFVLFYQ